MHESADKHWNQYILKCLGDLDHTHESMAGQHSDAIYYSKILRRGRCTFCM